MKLTEILNEDLVISNLQSDEKTGVLDEMTRFMQEKNLINDREVVLNALIERENLGSTGIGFNVAIPHAKVKEIQKMTAVFGRSTKGIEFDSLDQEPVHLICLLIAPENSTGPHIKALARISRLLKDDSLRNDLMKASDSSEMFKITKLKDDGLG